MVEMATMATMATRRRIGFFQKDLAHQVGSRSTAEAPRGAGVEAEEDRLGNEVGNEENKIFFTRNI